MATTKKATATKKAVTTSTKTRKATEVMDGKALLDSTIERYTPVIKGLQEIITDTNKTQLETSIKIGEALRTVRDAYKKAGINLDEFLTWADDTFNLKKAMVYNDITLADNKDNKVVVEALESGKGVAETLKEIREEKKANKKGKAPADKIEAKPVFEYVVRRTSAENAKPGEGSAEEVAKQLQIAIASVLEGKDQTEQDAIMTILLGIKPDVTINTPRTVGKSLLKIAE